MKDRFYWLYIAALLCLMVCPLALVDAPPIHAQTKVIGIPNNFSSITINGQTMSNVPHMTWTPWGPFTYATANKQGALWQPTDAIEVTAIAGSVTTDVTGCTTYPQLGVFDITTSTWVATFTMSSGVFGFYSSASGLVAAGDKLQAGIATAGVGCTGTSGSVYFTVEYIMQ